VHKFCGQPVTLVVSHAERSPALALPSTTFIAEFALRSLPLKTDISPGQGCYLGEVSTDPSTGEVRVVFNEARCGWYYGWTSSRHTSQSLHVFRVYTLQANKPVHVFDSTPFVITRDRTKPKQEKESPSKAMVVVKPLSTTSVHPLDTILQVIRCQFRLGESLDADGWQESWDDSPGRWSDTDSVSSKSSQSMDVEEQDEKLLAIERMNAILCRMCIFVFNNIIQWKTISELHANLQKYMLQEEGISLHGLAQELGRLFDIKPLDSLPAIFPDNIAWTSQSALAEVHSVVSNSPDLQLVCGFNMDNDLSGSYRGFNPDSRSLLSSETKAAIGRFFLERTMDRECPSDFLPKFDAIRVQTLNSSQISFGHVGHAHENHEKILTLYVLL